MNNGADQHVLMCRQMCTFTLAKVIPYNNSEIQILG